MVTATFEFSRVFVPGDGGPLPWSLPADNGPDARDQAVSGIAARDRSARPEFAATNGLRQCKGSLYEGGIRTPGILEWPARITRHAETWHPVYVSDYLPTLLELLGATHPRPDWAADGMSLLPLITRLGASGGVDKATRRPREHPLVFSLSGQTAIIDNEWKILEDPSAGHCVLANGSPVLSPHDWDPQLRWDPRK